MQSRPIAATAGGASRAAAESSTGGPLSIRAVAILGALVALLVIYATDQIVPASSDRQAQLRLWLVARSTGIVAYLLLTVQVVLGLVLSHPTNKSTWKLSRALFGWHEQLWVFVVAFIAVHVVSLVLDPHAGVGLSGAFVPGLSEYRSVPVALGTISLYALLVTAVTGRYTRLLPRGAWLAIHRLSFGVIALAWLHSVLAGSDSGALEPLYAASGLALVGAAAYRYWMVRRGRAIAVRNTEVPAT